MTGVLEIATAIRLRKEIQGEFWLALGGVVSILFGVVVAAQPVVGRIHALAYMAGFYAILFGVFFLMLGLRLRKAHAPSEPLRCSGKIGDGISPQSTQRTRRKRNSCWGREAKRARPFNDEIAWYSHKSAPFLRASICRRLNSFPFFSASSAYAGGCKSKSRVLFCRI